MPQLDTTYLPSQIFWLVIHFGLFYLLMAKVALPRIALVLDRRHAVVDADVRAAKHLQQEIDYLKADIHRHEYQAKNTSKAALEAAVATAATSSQEKRRLLEDSLKTMIAQATERLHHAEQQAFKDMATATKTLCTQILDVVLPKHPSISQETGV
jgi:F-type H+-transporting ATPase subunit b